MTERWSVEQARDWYANQPWLVGCNFIPSSAGNQIEMWRQETFDPDTIGRELDMAAGLGMNAVRVYLHDLVWEEDAAGFKARIARFLDMADARGIRAMVVFFDDCWLPEPLPGPQPEPVPGVHNSVWVNSPGQSAAVDSAQEKRLKAYVQDIVAAFGQDDRVLLWDVYNELGNIFMPTMALPLARRIPRLLAKYTKYRFGSIPTLPLFRKALAWIREMDPKQPLTSPVYFPHPKLNRELIESSDIVSFHNYENEASVRKQIAALKEHGRPVMCTEYLSRGEGSVFETVLPVFKAEDVAAFSWGLVFGKTQTVYPWKRPGDGGEPELWFHDIFRKDGTPFDPEEPETIRRLTGTDSAKDAD